MDHIECEIKTYLSHDHLLNQDQVLSLHNQIKNTENPVLNDVNIKNSQIVVTSKERMMAA